jgi:hypothetical protein
MWIARENWKGSILCDRLCGLVVRVPSSIPDATRFFWEVAGLERSLLSFMGKIEELQFTARGFHNFAYEECYLLFWKYLFTRTFNFPNIYVIWNEPSRPTMSILYSKNYSVKNMS